MMRLILILATTPAWGASMEYCHPYADAIVRMTAPVWGQDPDVEAYVAARAYSTCLNADEPPGVPFVMGVTAEAPGTVPATDSPHVEACRAGWPRSYDEATGTVRRNGRGKRVPCPIGDK